MIKINKSQVKELLYGNIISSSENSIKFLFHIFSFDLKEFKQEVARVSFEVHYKRNFVMRVSVTENEMSFNNEWVNFQGDTTGMSMQAPSCMAEVIAVFINMFGPNILTSINYDVVYSAQWSVFESHEEAQEYLWIVQATVGEIINKSNTKHN